MKLVALMPVRNEAWVLGASLRAALRWCDHVVVLNHASTDSTAGIICDVAEEFSTRVTSLYEPRPEWKEMDHRQRMLEVGREIGGTHFALVDADEILTGNLVPTIRYWISKLQPTEILQVGMLAMWRSLDHYRVGQSIWSNRHDLTLAFCDHPSLGWAARNGYDHHSREPHGSRRSQFPHVQGGVMHLQWASWRRLVAKHARYKMDERIKYPNRSIQEIDRMYSLALDEKGIEVQTVEPEWWAPHMRYRGLIELGAEPWQERQCREWIAEHGPEMFQGLHLFGVV
jgi:hypothetical protein